MGLESCADGVKMLVRGASLVNHVREEEEMVFDAVDKKQRDKRRQNTLILKAQFDKSKRNR